MTEALPTGPKRDVALDAWRALVMIHIVCIVHVFYWRGGLAEPWLSMLLFEMPCIFFIAGAAQAVKPPSGLSLRRHVAGRARRLLLPMAMFLPVLLVVMALLTPLGLSVGGQPIDVRLLNAADIGRILLTAGNAKIPFYSYTWFVSVYLVVVCTLPIQLRLLRRVPLWAWIAAHIAVVGVLSLVPLPLFENELKSIPVYNFFFLLGYFCYRRTPRRWLIAVAAVANCVVAWAFLSGNAVPMQGHKFPPDLLFVAFGLASISLFALTLGRVRLPMWPILRLWNAHGYNIYLYQIFAVWAVSLATEPWIDALGSPFWQSTVIVLLTFVANTALCPIVSRYHAALLRLLRLG